MTINKITNAPTQNGVISKINEVIDNIVASDARDYGISKIKGNNAGWATGKTTTEGQNITSIIYANDKFIAIDKAGNIYHSSTDGLTLNKVSTISGFSNSNLYIAYSSYLNEYIIIDSNCLYATSSDGVNFTTPTQKWGLSGIVAISYDETYHRYFLLQNNPATLYYFSDFNSSSYNSEAIYSGTNYKGLAINSNYVVVLRSSGYYYYASLTNLTSWYNQYIGSNNPGSNSVVVDPNTDNFKIFRSDGSMYEIDGSSITTILQSNFQYPGTFSMGVLDYPYFTIGSYLIAVGYNGKYQTLSEYNYTSTIVQNSGSDITSENFDGQWIYKYSFLTNSVATTKTTVDLSAYLPNDLYNYEVLGVFGREYLDAGGAFQLGSDVFDVPYDTTTGAYSVMLNAGGYSRAATTQFILPVGQGRCLYTIGSVATNKMFLYLVGYRRIGTNC